MQKNYYDAKGTAKKHEGRISTLEKSLANRTAIAQEASAEADWAMAKYGTCSDENEDMKATVERLEVRQTAKQLHNPLNQPTRQPTNQRLFLSFE